MIKINSKSSLISIKKERQNETNEHNNESLYTLMNTTNHCQESIFKGKKNLKRNQTAKQTKKMQQISLKNLRETTKTKKVTTKQSKKCKEK